VCRTTRTTRSSRRTGKFVKKEACFPIEALPDNRLEEVRAAEAELGIELIDEGARALDGWADRDQICPASRRGPRRPRTQQPGGRTGSGVPSEPIDVETLSRNPAVGEAYAAEPLVYHGAWKRPTLEALAAADRAIGESRGFGTLPLLYIHGADDQLVPVELARPVIERLAGPNSALHVLDGARHEVSTSWTKRRRSGWWRASRSA
jgi:alpha-beta hydrolase superfamily lysophospholipase